MDSCQMQEENHPLSQYSSCDTLPRYSPECSTLPLDTVTESGGKLYLLPLAQSMQGPLLTHCKTVPSLGFSLSPTSFLCSPASFRYLFKL